MHAWPDLWIWSTDCIFYNFLYKEFINRRAMHKFIKADVLSRQSHKTK